MTHTTAAHEYANSNLTILGVSQGFDYAWYVALYNRTLNELVSGQETRRQMGYSSHEITPSDVIEMLNADGE